MTEEKKEVSKRETMELFNLPAIYSDKVFIAGTANTVRISFCEGVIGTEDNRARVNVALSPNVFANFVDAANRQLNMMKQMHQAMLEKQATEAPIQ